MPPVPLAGVWVTECIQFARRILAEAVHRIGEARASYRLVYCGDLFGNVIEGFSDGYQETFGNIPAWHELEAPAQRSKSYRNDL